MKNYITPDIVITYFNSENIITASGETEVTAEIQKYANTNVRLRQVEFNNIIGYSE